MDVTLSESNVSSSRPEVRPPVAMRVGSTIPKHHVGRRRAYSLRKRTAATTETADRGQALTSPTLFQLPETPPQLKQYSKGWLPSK